ncbi:MAG TPA: hypothetical protein PLF32_07910 [Bacteroidales bacterium]|nr:hypothetical protein [Bacteroidales bacterium]
MDTSTSIGKSYSGERSSNPSDQDIKNIGIKAKIGIVIDMVGGVHLYNKQNTVSLSENFFFSIK